MKEHSVTTAQAHTKSTAAALYRDSAITVPPAFKRLSVFHQDLKQKKPSSSRSRFRGTTTLLGKRLCPEFYNSPSINVYIHKLN